jgi:hypothetical protein
MNPWRKLLLFTFIVILPAVVVGMSNFKAFPESSFLATVMLLTTMGVAGLFTWKSNHATPKIVRYCIIADIIICALLCVNVGCHWIFSRELSGAKQSTVERHTEEDREEKRKAAEADRQLALKKADADLAAKNAQVIAAEERRLARLPRWMRQSQTPIAAPAAPAPTPSTLALSADSAPESQAAAKPKATEEQVRENWWWTLIALAFAECFASILAGGILMGVWEWDRNHDGIPDHLQQGRGAHLVPGAQPVAGFARGSRDERGESDPKARSDQG